MFESLQVITLILFIVNATLVFLSDGYCYSFSSSCTKDGLRITSPFWITTNSSLECQYPGFEIKCQSEKPVMNISNHLYYVREISLDYSLQLVDTDIEGQECPQPRHNFSLQLEPFLDSYYSEMTIFYNCTLDPESGWYEFACLENSYHNNKTRRSYGFYQEEIPKRFDRWYNYCQDKVVIPALSRDSNYTNNLKLGFFLDWFQPVDCDNCMDSGGKCSANQTSGGISCQCPDGRTRLNDICPSYAESGTSIMLKVIIGVSIGVGGLLLIVFLIYRNLVYSLYNRIFKIETPVNVEGFLENYGCPSLQRYKYSDVKKMTNSFRETLGQGGYGTVYKGKLRGDCLVAIKVLNESKGNGEDFVNEVASIGRTNHVNVVSLLGFCVEGNKQALVYELMSNGSLEKFIYKNQQSSTITTPPLGWEKLHHIALGVAKGLEYLHRGCNTRILHLDIKPHNILLDHHFCPKISDFGLAKLCPTLASLVSIVGARGTPGYIAPEVYCRNFGGVSHKSDVYSYGMMVLEMIGGRKNIDATVTNISEIYFPHWIYNHLEQGNKLHGSEERKIEGSEENYEDEKAKKMIIVALWCIQAHPIDRPSMRKVAEMLEGDIEELQMPPNPNMDPQSKNSSSP